MKLFLILLTIVSFNFSEAKKMEKRKVANVGQVPDCAKEASDDTPHMGYSIVYDIKGKSANDAAKFLDLLNGYSMPVPAVVPWPRMKEDKGDYTELRAHIAVVPHEPLRADFLKALNRLAQLEGVAIGCDIETKE